MINKTQEYSIQKSIPVEALVHWRNPYRVIKCPLKKVLNHYNDLQPIIENYVREINQIVILGYQFIQLYILEHYNKGLDLPTIDQKWIENVLKVICVHSEKRGRPCEKESIDTKKDLKIFYNNIFSQVIKIPLMTSYHKSYCLKEQSKEMFNCLITNLKTNFIKYLSKYINLVHRQPRAFLIHQEKDPQKRKQLYAQLNTDMRNLKTDLIEDTLQNSDPSYHDWIQKEKKFMIPDNMLDNVAFDLKVQPLNYLIPALYINHKIEELGSRPYQVIPQRKSQIPHHITLDSTSIVELIWDHHQILSIPKFKCPLKRSITQQSEQPQKTKKPTNISLTYLKNNAGSYHELIWNRVLKLDHRTCKNDVFNQQPYTFYYQIKTNGFSCSLLFILEKYQNRKHGQKFEKHEHDDEYPQLKNLTKAQCDVYLKGNYKIISLDPGEIDPVSTIDERNQFFQYSACQRRQETYTKRSSEILYAEKLKHNIFAMESPYLKQNPHVKKKKKKFKHRRKKHKRESQSLPLPLPVKRISSRTTNPDQYQEFIGLKNEIDVQTKSFYENLLFRKLAFRRFVRTQQSEVKLVKTISHQYLTQKERTEDKKLLILYGDHSRGSQMKGCVPCPGRGMRRLLAKYFQIIEVDEYLTSQIHHQRKQKMDHLVVRENNHRHRVHKILTLLEDNERCIYVNRDYNACRNILNLGLEYLKTQTRPIEFQRKKKSGDVIK